MVEGRSEGSGDDLGDDAVVGVVDGDTMGRVRSMDGESVLGIRKRRPRLNS